MHGIMLFSFSALAVVAGLASWSAVAGEKEEMRAKADDKTEVMLVKKAGGRTETIRIKSAAEIDDALGLAAREGGGAAALEVSCSPPDHDWCANGFQAACAKNKGGLSTNPDGSITCSMPD